MQCKIFYAQSRKELETQLNKWLKENPVSPETMRFQFSTVSLDDETQFILEHTVIIMYIPMMSIGDR